MLVKLVQLEELLILVKLVELYGVKLPFRIDKVNVTGYGVEPVTGSFFLQLMLSFDDDPFNDFLINFGKLNRNQREQKDKDAFGKHSC